MPFNTTDLHCMERKTRFDRQKAETAVTNAEKIQRKAMEALSKAKVTGNAKDAYDKWIIATRESAMAAKNAKLFAEDKLRIAFNYADDKQIQRVDDALLLSATHNVLSVTCSTIESQGMESLASILNRGALPNCKELILSNNNIGDAGIAALAQAIKPGGSGALSQCTVLQLGSNTFGDAGIIALADACRRGALPKCQILSLDDNYISNTGLLAFADAIMPGGDGPSPLPECTSLLLSGNQYNDSIDDNLARALEEHNDRKALPKLNKLILRKEAFTVPPPKLTEVCSRRDISLGLTKKQIV